MPIRRQPQERPHQSNAESVYQDITHFRPAIGYEKLVQLIRHGVGKREASAEQENVPDCLTRKKCCNETYREKHKRGIFHHMRSFTLQKV